MYPLVSIVIPIYNGEKYMREAINSALAQSYPNIEVIVVNDGSTDSTDRIAKSYGNRIRYYKKENGGVSTALNLAIVNMRGEYFSWLSHDDVYYPDKIKVEMEALYRSGYSEQVVYSDWDRIFSLTGEISYSPDATRIKSYGKEIVETGALAPAIGFISGCSLLIPKLYFDEYGMFDESLCAVQDYKKWFEMFRGKRLIYVPRPLIQSRVHSLQTTNTYKKIDFETNFLYECIVDSMNENDLKGSGISLYLFYGAMITKLMADMVLPFNKLAAMKLLALNEPDNACEDIKYLKQHISKSRQLFLYCSGRRCKSLVLALKLRNISVVAISDSDSSRYGNTILGIPIVPLDKIPIDASIIVTKTSPEDVCNKLEEYGYKYVTTYDSIMGDILRAPVRRDNVIRLCEGEIWDTLQKEY